MAILGLTIAVLTILIIFGLSLDIAVLQGLNALIYAIFFYKIHKVFKKDEISENGNLVYRKSTELLATFSRPVKLTEEEVSISKEKKVCLVCKTSLENQIYLCSKCGTFYCMKCSNMLTGLENACWVCNMPFDESKPTKPFIETEENIKFESKL